MDVLLCTRLNKLKIMYSFVGIHLKQIKTLSRLLFLVAPKADSWLSALGVCLFLYNALEIVVYVIEIVPLS